MPSFFCSFRSINFGYPNLNSSLKHIFNPISIYALTIFDLSLGHIFNPIYTEDQLILQLSHKVESP